MRIVVCMKQVPRLDEIRFTRANRIEREGVAAIANPLDLRALAHALALRDADGGEVTAVTMGPPGARTMLADALARGADAALHLVDRRFAGADTLATARALARAVDGEDAELLLFGRSTLDGATAQVGPQVAELLGLPFIGQAVEIARADGGLEVERETERGWERWRLALPAAISVEQGPAPPEPAARDDGAARAVRELDFEALGGTPRDYGTRGSPTFVREVRELSLDRAPERVEGAEQGAARIRALVEERLTEVPDAQPPGGGASRRALWALAERDGAGLHPVSLEAIACARTVAGELDAEVVAVVFADEPRDLPGVLAGHGADRVLVVRDRALETYTPDAYAAALDAALDRDSPFAVIAPWTTQGREYVARVAARRGLGLTGDFVRLEVAGADTEEPDLMWIKPAWAATVEAPIIAHTTPSLGTLRPGVVRALAAAGAGANAPVETFEPAIDAPGGPVLAGRRGALAEGEPLLDAAPVMVLAGAALGADGVDAAAAAARALGGALGATAAAVAAGLAPAQREIGLLKRSLSPLCVVALGAEAGDALDAVRGARTLVAIDRDPHAPALARADLAIVAEPAAVARALAGAPTG